MSASVQLELNALKKVLQDKNPELLVRLSPRHFGNEELAKLFSLVKRFFVDTGQFIGWDVLRSNVASKCSTADKQRYLMALLDQIQERDIAGLTDDMLMAELTDQVKMRHLLLGLQDIAHAAEARDTEKAFALFSGLQEQILLTGDNEILNSDMLALAGADVSFEWRTTGVPDIDRRNGISLGSLVLICGDTGTGKSTRAHSIGIHQYNKYREGVAYWSWEQGKKEIMARIWSHESDVDLGNIISDELTREERGKLRVAKLKFLFINSDVNFVEESLESGLSEEEFIREAALRFERKPEGFYIYDHAPNFDDLLVEMELLRSTKGVRIYICDYITIIPAGAGHRGLQSWERYLEMSKALKTFARRGNCIVITPLQFDSKEGKIRFSQNIINDADLALFMSQDKEDLELGTVTNKFAKFRNYRTIPGEPLSNFKQLRAFDRAKFLDISF